MVRIGIEQAPELEKARSVSNKPRQRMRQGLPGHLIGPGVQWLKRQSDLCRLSVDAPRTGVYLAAPPRSLAVATLSRAG
jgi:hypothetical protein